MQIIRWKRFATLRPEAYSPDTDKTEATGTAIGRTTDRKTSLCEPHPGSLLPGESARIDEKEPLSFHYHTYKKSVTARFLELLRFFLQESPLNLPAPIFDCRNQCDRHGQRRQPGKYKTYYTNFSSFLIRSILSFSSARTFS